CLVWPYVKFAWLIAVQSALHLAFCYMAPFQLIESPAGAERRRCRSGEKAEYPRGSPALYLWPLLPHRHRLPRAKRAGGRPRGRYHTARSGPLAGAALIADQVTKPRRGQAWSLHVTMGRPR